MKPEILTLVERALDEGRYPVQCEGGLSRQTVTDNVVAYCFLGMLCDLSGLGVWKAQSVVPGDESCMRRYVLDSLGYDTSLPLGVATWAGVDEEEERLVMEWNDNPTEEGTMRTFEDILALLKEGEWDANETAKPCDDTR